MHGTVPGDARIALDSGRHSGTWQTPDLSVAYHYDRNGGDLKLSGVVRLSDRMKNNFLLIEYLHLDAIFCDEAGHVLQMRGLSSAPPGSSEDPMEFSNALHLPPNTASLAFSYRGEARTGSDDGGNTNYF